MICAILTRINGLSYCELIKRKHTHKKGGCCDNVCVKGVCTCDVKYTSCLIDQSLSSEETTQIQDLPCAKSDQGKE